MPTRGSSQRAWKTWKDRETGVLVWIEGGKREAAKRRPMVRKMKNLDPRAIAKGLNTL